MSGARLLMPVPLSEHSSCPQFATLATCPFRLPVFCDLPRLTPAQFKAILDLAERRELSDGTRLTTEHEWCSHLYFVESQLR